MEANDQNTSGQPYNELNIPQSELDQLLANQAQMKPTRLATSPPVDRFTLSYPTLGPLTSGRLPEIELFEHIDFNHITTGSRDTMGDPPGGWSFRTSFNIDFNGDPKDNNLSSFIIYSGFWQMYRDTNFQNPIGPIFGPGQYSRIQMYTNENDTVTSIRCVSYEHPLEKNVRFAFQ